MNCKAIVLIGIGPTPTLPSSSAYFSQAVLPPSPTRFCLLQYIPNTNPSPQASFLTHPRLFFFFFFCLQRLITCALFALLFSFSSIALRRRVFSAKMLAATFPLRTM
jgi:hypothetical protein